MAEILSHAAVYMDAKYLKAGAAVGTADAAGITVAAVQVGIHDYLVPYFEALWVVLGDGLDDTGQFMADDPGIRHQGIGSAEGADIAAADAGSLDPDQCLSRAGNRLLKLY